MFGDRVFAPGIKLKGHHRGGTSSRPGALAGGGDEDTDTHGGRTMWRRREETALSAKERSLGSISPSTPQPPTSILQSCEERDGCCLDHSCCGICYAALTSSHTGSLGPGLGQARAGFLPASRAPSICSRPTHISVTGPLMPPAGCSRHVSTLPLPCAHWDEAPQRAHLSGAIAAGSGHSFTILCSSRVTKQLISY